MDAGMRGGPLVAYRFDGEPALDAGRFDEISTVTLLDPSPEMISTSKERVAAAWPDAGMRSAAPR